MKNLTLVCDCGRRKRFDGENIEVILAAIDQSKWADYTDDERPLPRGQQHAVCPKCLDRPQSYAASLDNVGASAD